ncbi:hypothetical protein FNF27_02246 [Cafeteria roenbergensis]|nr:hypothetical protein FNF29_02394 [Cafeteria roenbergensis]KAA0158202.1 hypothetical protein FNF28_06359 [Cafeteria roenbergensis]KAA0168026.1 hypothetical protein FNF31_00525 [Cafeteria roenbergensis]KAA0176189.1 hypothetical protein FNF27_02246 [Cafeteria roenbergensis]|eukprot:KAA0154517.1 hypothetical protein FNF29_02394 [Cafeteria roenbergensis]
MRGHPRSWEPAAPSLLAKEPLTWEPAAVELPPHGWAPATGAVPETLPFAVDRAGPAGSLPVYRDIRHGRTKIYTVVRKIRGDTEAMAQELHKLCRGAPVTQRPGRIEVDGDHKLDVVRYLSGLGL